MECAPYRYGVITPRVTGVGPSLERRLRTRHRQIGGTGGSLKGKLRYTDQPRSDPGALNINLQTSNNSQHNHQHFCYCCTVAKMVNLLDLPVEVLCMIQRHVFILNRPIGWLLNDESVAWTRRDEEDFACLSYDIGPFDVCRQCK